MHTMQQGQPERLSWQDRRQFHNDFTPQLQALLGEYRNNLRGGMGGQMRRQNPMHPVPQAPVPQAPMPQAAPMQTPAPQNMVGSSYFLRGLNPGASAFDLPTY